MAWGTPKTDWSIVDGVTADDLNRIEGNIGELITSNIYYGSATGTNAKVITLNPAPILLYEGLALSFKNVTANTGSVTLNVNGLGAKTIIKANGKALSSGNLKAGSIYTVRYNGTNFILQGEGGSGNAISSEVLVGKTFTNDDGEFTGTMINRSGTTVSGTRRASGSGYVDLSMPEGYYNGATNTRVRASDINLIGPYIKKGISIFGIAGTLGEKAARGEAYNTTGSSEFIDIYNLGFKPRVVVAKAADQGDKNRWAAVYTYTPWLYGDLDFRIADNGSVYTNNSQLISDNHFRLQVDSISRRLWYWMAFGSEDY